MNLFLDIKAGTIQVKWENYEKPTWEPLSNMPIFIQKFVEINGCGKIPSPIVKHVKEVDGNCHALLEWNNDVGEKVKFSLLYVF